MLINTLGMDSILLGNKRHFMIFTAVVAIRNRTEGSNFHFFMARTIEMSSKTMFTGPCSQTVSSSFPKVEHVTFAARDALNKIRSGTRGIVLDMI